MAKGIDWKRAIRELDVSWVTGVGRFGKLTGPQYRKKRRQFIRESRKK